MMASNSHKVFSFLRKTFTQIRNANVFSDSEHRTFRAASTLFIISSFFLTESSL
jgi:hypothetical protein